MALAPPRPPMQQTHYRPHPAAPNQPPSQPPHYPPSYVTGQHTPRQPGPPQGHPRGYGPPPPGYQPSPGGGQPMMGRPPGGPPPPQQPGGGGGHMPSEREAQQQYMVASLQSAGAPVSGNALVAGAGGPPPGTYYSRPPGPGAIGQGRPGMGAGGGPGGARMMVPGGHSPHPPPQQQPAQAMHGYGGPPPPGMVVQAQAQGGGPAAQQYPQYVHVAPQPPYVSQQQQQQQRQQQQQPPTPSITMSSPHPAAREAQPPPLPPHAGVFAPQTYQTVLSPSATPHLIHPNAAQSPLRAPDPPMRVANGNLSVQDPQSRLRTASTPQQVRPPPPQQQQQLVQASLPPPPPPSAVSPAPPRIMHPPAQMVPRTITAPPMTKTEPPHGSAILRLLQFFAGLADGETRGDLSYWQNHVHTYYTESGSLMYALKSQEDSSKRYFDLACSALPRYFLTSYLCGLRSIALNLENPRESRAPYSPQHGNRTITVDVSRASMTNIYTNDSQVVFRGALKCVMIFTPNEAPEGGGPPSGGGSLLIDRMEFNTASFVEFIARTSVKRQPVYRVVEPAPASSSSSAGAGGQVGKAASTPAGQAPTPGMTPNSTGASHAALPPAKSADKGKGREEAISEVDEDGAGLDDGDGKEAASSSQAAATAAASEPSGLAGTDGGEGGSQRTDQSPLSTTTKLAKQPLIEVVGETVTMPDQVINSYGVSAGALRCLEIAQTVGQMGPLMAFCQTQGVSPQDGLRRFADRVRSRVSSATTSGGQTAPQTPAPAGGSLAQHTSSPHPPLPTKRGHDRLPSASQLGVPLTEPSFQDIIDGTASASQQQQHAGQPPVPAAAASASQAAGDKADDDKPAVRGSLKRKKSNLDDSDGGPRSSTTPDSQRPGSSGPMTRRRSRITLNGDLP